MGMFSRPCVIKHVVEHRHENYPATFKKILNMKSWEAMYITGVEQNNLRVMLNKYKFPTKVSRHKEGVLVTWRTN